MWKSYFQTWFIAILKFSLQFSKKELFYTLQFYTLLFYILQLSLHSEIILGAPQKRKNPNPIDFCFALFLAFIWKF